MTLLPVARADTWWRGVAYTSWWHDAYEQPESDAALIQAKATGVNAITLLTTEYMQTAYDDNIIANEQTPSAQNLKHVIKFAHKLGLKVILKPHVDVVNDTWRGEINPNDKNLWWQSYHDFILKYAVLARELRADAYVIGTELKSMSRDTQHWEQIIRDVHEAYSGPLTYAANWDEFQKIRFWGKLDWIGIDAYFPLRATNPYRIDDVVGAWRTPITSLMAIQHVFNKPVVFTEAGYESAANTLLNPWGVSSPQLDLDAQRVAYEALLRSFSRITWFRGVFWWNWVPQAEEERATSFTPQGKPAAVVMSRYYNMQLPTLDNNFRILRVKNIKPHRFLVQGLITHGNSATLSVLQRNRKSKQKNCRWFRTIFTCSLKISKGLQLNIKKISMASTDAPELDKWSILLRIPHRGSYKYKIIASLLGSRQTSVRYWNHLTKMN